MNVCRYKIYTCEYREKPEAKLQRKAVMGGDIADALRRSLPKFVVQSGNFTMMKEPLSMRPYAYAYGGGGDYWVYDTFGEIKPKVERYKDRYYGDS